MVIVMESDFLFVPAVAVIFTVPALRPETLPLESTVATEVSEEVQVTEGRLPAGSVVTSALSCTLCVEARSMEVSPETLMAVTVTFLGWQGSLASM